MYKAISVVILKIQRLRVAGVGQLIKIDDSRVTTLHRPPHKATSNEASAACNQDCLHYVSCFLIL